jgi:hypothetical protein
MRQIQLGRMKWGFAWLYLDIKEILTNVLDRELLGALMQIYCRGTLE